MKKKKLLFCSQWTGSNTGYANHYYSIINKLKEKYDVAELACEYDWKNKKDQPWLVYPNNPQVQDEDYKKNDQNKFGEYSFNRVCCDFKPDVVIDMRDVWNFEFQERNPYRRLFKWLVMPAVDAEPQTNDWLRTIANADGVLTYTEWNKSVLDNSSVKINTLGFAPTIINPEYKPKSGAKRRLLLNQKSTIVGTVMRSNPRKHINRLIIAFSEILDKIPRESYLYLHCTYPDKNCYDIPQILIDNGVQNRVYFSYSCDKCNFCMPNLINDCKIVCKRCESGLLKIGAINKSIDESQLSDIYNSFDCYVQYASSEGLGIPQLEAAYCGKPVITVDYSAMSDIAKKLDCISIPPKEFNYELGTECKRCIPDDEKLKEELIRVFNTPKELLSIEGRRQMKLAHENYSAKSSIDTWVNAIESVGYGDWTKEPEIRDTIPSFEMVYSEDNYEFARNVVEKVVNTECFDTRKLIFKIIEDLNYGFTKPVCGPYYYNSAYNIRNLEYPIDAEYIYKAGLKLRDYINTWEYYRSKN